MTGDAVWEQERWLPQIAVGVQHKRAGRGAVIRAVGGRRATGTDVYVAATKVLLARSLVLDATLRLRRPTSSACSATAATRNEATARSWRDRRG